MAEQELSQGNVIRAAFEQAIEEFNEQAMAAKLLTDVKVSEAEKRDYLIREIMSRMTLRTLSDTGEILYYEGGIYKRGAEPKILAELQKIGGSEITNFRRNEVLAAIRALTSTDRNDFDKEPILNLKNGFLKLNTWKFEEHSSDYLSMMQLPVSYDPKHTCRQTIEFLYDVIADPTDVPLVLEYLAYCLIADKDLQKEMLLIGPPDGGKSKLLDLMTALLGSQNVSNVTMQQLSTNRFALAQIDGRLANIYADISHARLEDIERFKAIATADEVEAEKKGMQLFKFRPRAKLIYSANIPPRPPITVDDSYYRRWMLIQCALRDKHYFSKTPIVKDPKIIRKLTTEDELSGLLNLVLISLKRLMENQRFCKEVSTEATRELYDKLSNPVKMWIDSDCEEDSNSELEIDIGFRSYVEFCKVRRITPMRKEWVGRELGNLGFVTEQRGTGKNRKRVWIGLNTRKASFPSLIEQNSSIIQVEKGPLCVSNESEQASSTNTEIVKI